MTFASLDEMIDSVPPGGYQWFERSNYEPYEELFFQVWQSWDGRPERMVWTNKPPFGMTPWLGNRAKPRIGLDAVQTPDLRFDGPSSDLVDFYSTGTHAFIVSDRLVQLIETIDPGSVYQVPLAVPTKDGEVQFYAVLPRRVIDALDPRRTTVQVSDTMYGTAFSRSVNFPEGIVLDNDCLKGIASFADTQTLGWYWSRQLIDLAKAEGIRGLYAKSVATYPAREVARL